MCTLITTIQHTTEISTFKGKHMKEYKEITRMEEVESKHIKNDYTLVKGITTVVITIITIISGLLLSKAMINEGTTVEYIGCVCMIALVLAFLILIGNAIIQPYKELYKIALNNDMIRHNEQIRNREQERLKKEQDNKPRPPRPIKQDSQESHQNLYNH